MGPFEEEVNQLADKQLLFSPSRQQKQAVIYLNEESICIGIINVSVEKGEKFQEETINSQAVVWHILSSITPPK